MKTIEARRKVGWLAALACEAVMFGCGGNLTPSNAAGGKGGDDSSTTGAAGSMVAMGAGGMSNAGSTGNTTTGAFTTGAFTTGATTTGATTTGATTTGATTTGATTTGGTGGAGGCGGVGCCDERTWPGVGPVPITTSDCSDFDSNVNAAGLRCTMPGGIWSVDVDNAPGSTTTAGSYKIEPCGTTGNGFHFMGHGHTLWGADLAAAIVSQTQPVDASAYVGMSFVMKSKTSSVLIFKVQNSYSQPPCGKCDDSVIGNECYSGYIKTVPLPANDATPIVVKWADLFQQTWGYRPPGSALFDPRDLISVAFAFDKGIDFDVCIDDVKFVR
jgi:hypothetical protein